jgi:hypothetical protein
MEFDTIAAMQAGVPPEENRFVVLCVANRGSVPCQVNTVWILSFPSLWAYWRRKHSESSIVMRPMSERFGCKVPFKLERSGEFRAICLQNERLEELSRKTWLYAAISHSMSEHAFRVRIKAIPERKTVPLEAAAKAA